MPRQTPVKEILKNEETTVGSPLRRSSRLNSPAPTRILTRRTSSTDVTTPNTAKQTRSRRHSTSDSSTTTTGNRKGSEESHSPVDDTKKKAVNTPVTRRRASVTKDNSSEETPKRMLRSRSSSITKTNNEEVEIKPMTTRKRRSSTTSEESTTSSRSETKALEEKKNVTTRKKKIEAPKPNLDLSIIDESDDQEIKKIDDIIDQLSESEALIPSQSESAADSKDVANVSRKNVTKLDLNLSVIEESDNSEIQKITEVIDSAIDDSFSLHLSPESTEAPIANTSNKENISPGKSQSSLETQENVFAEKLSASMINNLESEPMDIDQTMLDVTVNSVAATPSKRVSLSLKKEQKEAPESSTESIPKQLAKTDSPIRRTSPRKSTQDGYVLLKDCIESPKKEIRKALLSSSVSDQDESKSPVKSDLTLDKVPTDNANNSQEAATIQTPKKNVQLSRELSSENIVEKIPSSPVRRSPRLSGKGVSPTESETTKISSSINKKFQKNISNSYQELAEDSDSSSPVIIVSESLNEKPVESDDKLGYVNSELEKSMESDVNKDEILNIETSIDDSNKECSLQQSEFKKENRKSLEKSESNINRNSLESKKEGLIVEDKEDSQLRNYSFDETNKSLSKSKKQEKKKSLSNVNEHSNTDEKQDDISSKISDSDKESSVQQEELKEENRKSLIKSPKSNISRNISHSKENLAEEKLGNPQLSNLDSIILSDSDDDMDKSVSENKKKEKKKSLSNLSKANVDKSQDDDTSKENDSSEECSLHQDDFKDESQSNINRNILQSGKKVFEIEEQENCSTQGPSVMNESRSKNKDKKDKRDSLISPQPASSISITNSNMKSIDRESDDDSEQKSEEIDGQKTEECEKSVESEDKGKPDNNFKVSSSTEEDSWVQDGSNKETRKSLEQSKSTSNKNTPQLEKKGQKVEKQEESQLSRENSLILNDSASGINKSLSKKKKKQKRKSDSNVSKDKNFDEIQDNEHSIVDNSIKECSLGQDEYQDENQKSSSILENSASDMNMSLSKKQAKKNKKKSVSNVSDNDSQKNNAENNHNTSLNRSKSNVLSKSEGETTILKSKSIPKEIDERLDELISFRLDEKFDSEDSRDSENEESTVVSEFLDDIAEEGEEDTPSEDSNEIIDPGEEINTTDTEVSDDTENNYEEDSFIDDEENGNLLSGSGDDLSFEGKYPKKSRLIQLDCDSDEEIIDVEKLQKKKKKKKVVKKKKSRIIRPVDDNNSSDEDNEVSKTDSEAVITPTVDSTKKEDIKDKKNTKSPAVSKIIIHENISVSEIESEELVNQIHQAVNSLCSSLNSSDRKLSVNLSVDYADQESSDEVFRVDDDKEPKTNKRKLEDTMSDLLHQAQQKKRKLNKNKKNKSSNPLDIASGQQTDNNTPLVESNVKESKPKRKRNKKKKAKKMLTSTQIIPEDLEQRETKLKEKSPLKVSKPSTSNIESTVSPVVNIKLQKQKRQNVDVIDNDAILPKKKLRRNKKNNNKEPQFAKSILEEVIVETKERKKKFPIISPSVTSSVRFWEEKKITLKPNTSDEIKELKPSKALDETVRDPKDFKNRVIDLHSNKRGKKLGTVKFMRKRGAFV